MDEDRRGVEDDPFWSGVRQRHPDLDIALLPPAGPTTDVPPDLPEREPDDVARRCAVEVEAVWRTCSPQAGPGAREARWLPGSDPRTVRRETTWRADDVEPAEAIEALRRAATALPEQGWHVFVPPTGMARVTAGRDAGIGREEVQVLHVEPLRRLVLRIRSGEFVVGEGAVGRIVPGGGA